MKKIKDRILEHIYFVSFSGVLVIVLFIFLFYSKIHIGAECLIFQTENETYLAYELPVCENDVEKEFVKEREFYLFLPSHADLEDVMYAGEFFPVKNLDLSSKLKYGCSLKDYHLNQAYSCVWNGQNIKLTVMKSENLPAMYIRTISGKYKDMWDSKDHTEMGEMRIVDEKGEILNREFLQKMKCRGNYSFNHYDKKPYSLKFDRDVSLLGLGEGEDYCLLSNASDPTMLRNHIARDMEKEIGLKYDNLGEFLDLYINGEYQGCYYLVEKIQIGPKRINIKSLEEEMKEYYGDADPKMATNFELPNYCFKAKNIGKIPEDISGGYLVEREFFDRYVVEYGEIGSGFRTKDGDCLVLHSPQECDVKQLKYLEKFFNEAETAIFEKSGIHPETKKSYQEYIDTDSFAIKYLVEEFTKNYDSGVSSNYFYKDSDLHTGKLYAGPAWDFDMSMGNYLEWMTFPDEGAKGITAITHHEFATRWFYFLCQHKNHMDLIEYYCEKKLIPYVNHLLNYGLRDYENKLKSSQQMNYIRWENDFKKINRFYNLENSYDQLYNFLKERKAIFEDYCFHNNDICD